MNTKDIESRLLAIEESMSAVKNLVNALRDTITPKETHNYVFIEDECDHELDMNLDFMFCVKCGEHL